MGFHATDELEAVLESHQENLTPPSKNRVWNFFTTSETWTGFSESQPVESHQEKWPTPTTTVSGVRYYGLRFYNPEIGRWCSRDPIKEKGFAKIFSVRMRGSGGKNLYVYCRNDAADVFDPVGLKCQQSPGCSEGATRELLSNCDSAGGEYTGVPIFQEKGDVTKEMPSFCCYCERKDYDVICDVTLQKCKKATVYCYDSKCNKMESYSSTAWFDESFTTKAPVKTVALGATLQWCHQASISDLSPPNDYDGWRLKQGFQCSETCGSLKGSDGE